MSVPAGDAPVLDDGRRARLGAVARALMPAAAGLPAADAIDATGRFLDRVLAADPSFAEPLARLADLDVDDPWQAAESLGAADPEAFERAADALVAAYTMHPRVRRALGYGGQKGAGPIPPDAAEWYLPDDLLDPVRARGAVYVPTPSPDA